MSLAKNLKQVTNIGPRAIVTWDKAERIRRNEEIWHNPESIVHRLPEHYKKRYWDNLLRDAVPVHYRPPTSRYVWDPTRNVEIEQENYPIVGIKPPEADEGLWGGEGIVKGWIESRPYTKKKVLPRNWVPHLWFPALKRVVLHSEILDKYMKITVTERACRLIDKHYGLDNYILESPEIDLASKLGNRLKREMLIVLAKNDYYPDDEERKMYISRKYSKFVIPLEEAEWVGLDINEAARKQQDLEEGRIPEPLKYRLERELVQNLMSGADTVTNEEEFRPKIEEKNQRTFTYGEFLNKTGQYVSILNGKYGIGKGDRVLSRCGKDLELVALYLACLRLGAIYIPANPAYTFSEISHYVKDSEPKLLVTSDEKTDGVLREKVPNVVRLDVIAKEARLEKSDLGVENVSETDAACVCYTSGTTGLPKGAMLTHGSLSSNAEALVQLWQFKHTDTLLHMLPFYHVHGMFISLNCSLFSHSTVIWRDKFAVDDCIEQMANSTVVMGVPTFYSRLLSSGDFKSDDCRNIRLFISGSAPLSLATWEQFKKATGHPILERYGMTEALVICSNPFEPAKRIPGTVGKPLDGTKLRLNNDGGIEIQSNALFAGYWKNPEKTKQDFTEDGYFITGDVAEIDDEGYVRILGRSKDIVITGGLNVYPKEIEDVIDKLENVAESAIIGCPHKDLGEGVVAVVALKKPLDNESDQQEMKDKLIRQLKAKLAGYKVPKDVVFMDKLPRNSMAKVQKKVLSEEFKDIFF